MPTVEELQASIATEKTSIESLQKDIRKLNQIKDRTNSTPAAKSTTEVDLQSELDALQTERSSLEAEKAALETELGL